jgi:amino acid transporter
MKKTVLTFGLIGGVIISVLMLCTVPFAKQIGFDKAVFVGYTTMVLSFMMVFFGIRSYRENVGGGTITFGRAFAVGALITLITSVFYVLTWQVIYFNFMPNFANDYSNYLIEKMRAAGDSQQLIEAKLEEMKQFKQMLDNPLINTAISFIEPIPVGLVITLISSLILRRRGTDPSPSKEPAQRVAA